MANCCTAAAQPDDPRPRGSSPEASHPALHSAIQLLPPAPPWPAAPATAQSPPAPPPSHHPHHITNTHTSLQAFTGLSCVVPAAPPAHGRRRLSPPHNAPGCGRIHPSCPMAAGSSWGSTSQADSALPSTPPRGLQLLLNGIPRHGWSSGCCCRARPLGA